MVSVSFQPKPHQLIIPESRNGPSHPHEKENEENDFGKQNHNTHNRTPDLVKDQGYRFPGNDNRQKTDRK